MGYTTDDSFQEWPQTNPLEISVTLWSHDVPPIGWPKQRPVVWGPLVGNVSLLSFLRFSQSCHCPLHLRWMASWETSRTVKRTSDPRSTSDELSMLLKKQQHRLAEFDKLWIIGNLFPKDTRRHKKTLSISPSWCTLLSCSCLHLLYSANYYQMQYFNPQGKKGKAAFLLISGESEWLSGRSPLHCLQIVVSACFVEHVGPDLQPTKHIMVWCIPIFTVITTGICFGN